MKQNQGAVLEVRPAPGVPGRLTCEDPLLTMTEAAAETGRALSTFRRDVKLGVLPEAIYVLPRAPRWRRSELRAAIAACPRGAPAKTETMRAA
jgi:predicted DNA-binding transcriptional regulator AlpA